MTFSEEIDPLFSQSQKKQLFPSLFQFRDFTFIRDISKCQGVGKNTPDLENKHPCNYQ
jgi:hypothetical protein